MAIAGPAFGVHHLGVVERARLLVASSRSPVRKFLILGTISCALVVAGCARTPERRELNPARHEVRATPVRVTARIRKHPEQHRSEARTAEQPRYSEPRIRRPDPELLAPKPSPDCEYKRADLKTVDPDEWARLKVEYERQCYQNAEKAARERLGLLQSSSACEIEPVPQQEPPQSARPR